MDINVKVVVDATDEVKDLLKLLTTKTAPKVAEPKDKDDEPVKTTKKVASKTTKKPEPESDASDDDDNEDAEDQDPDDDDQQDDDAPDVKVSFEKLRALGRKKMQTDEAKDKVRSFMLKKFKTAKLPDLSEDQWPTMYAFLNKL